MLILRDGPNFHLLLIKPADRGISLIPQLDFSPRSVLCLSSTSIETILTTTPSSQSTEPKPFNSLERKAILVVFGDAPDGLTEVLWHLTQYGKTEPVVLGVGNGLLVFSCGRASREYFRSTILVGRIWSRWSFLSILFLLAFLHSTSR
jgi:hypothetical protein